VAAACGAVGLTAGVFLERVVHRVPRKLREGVGDGRVRPILLAVVAAVLCAAVGARLGASAALPAYLYLVLVGVALAAIDVELHRLPDALTLPSYPVLLVLLAAASLADGDWGALARAAVGAVGMLVLYFVLMLAAVRFGGFGFGDVKLAGVLGLALGWLGGAELFLGAVLPFLYGAVVAIAAVVAVRGLGWKSSVPFGPSMIAAAFTAVLAGEEIVSAYVGLG
jgi:leader peptidase (prepilin peptidase)/N-methyltransferase